MRPPMWKQADLEGEEGGSGASAEWRRSTDATSRVEEAVARSLVVLSRRRRRAGRSERRAERAWRRRRACGVEAAASGRRVAVRRQHGSCSSLFIPQNYKLGLLGLISLSR